MILINDDHCNAQHSEVSKLVSHVLLARLDPAQSCLKVTKNLLFLSKMACSVIFDENSKFFVTLRQICAGSRRAKST